MCGVNNSRFHLTRTHARILILCKTATTAEQNETTVAEKYTYEYQHLMDRFRSRLVVPIWDAQNQHVLGFGGRLLPSVDEETLGPKYLNSPESAVFTKSQLVFGIATAAAAVCERPRPIILVEGYMDAISLSSVGVSTVVASMGTAISLEQLELISTKADSLVLCLDNDAAGIAAVERLCKNGFLSSDTLGKIDVRVAQLPERLKDPADFVDGRLASSSSADKVGLDFLQEVIDPAMEWTEWYVRRLVTNSYNGTAARGAKGSFGDVFESVAEFMGNSMKTAVRLKKAPAIAEFMENVLVAQENSTKFAASSPSMGESTLRVQLESDLLDLSSRIANARDVGSLMDLGKLAKGSWGEDEYADESSGIQQPLLPPGSFQDDDWGGKTVPHVPRIKGPSLQKQAASSSQKKVQSRSMREKKRERALTPHFSGFDFAHKSDAEWLGLNQRNKVSTRVGVASASFSQASIIP